jgi:rubrerythrin
MDKSGSQRSFASVEEILEFAVSMEEASWKFYTDWADKAGNQAISDVFREFAAEELKHRKLIEEVMAGDRSFRTRGGVSDLKLTDHYVTPEPSETMSYQDALLVAIDREVAAIELYTHLDTVCVDESLCRTFEALAGEEKKHKLRLETIYDDNFMKED